MRKLPGCWPWEWRSQARGGVGGRWGRESICGPTGQPGFQMQLRFLREGEVGAGAERSGLSSPFPWCPPKTIFLGYTASSGTPLGFSPTLISGSATFPPLPSSAPYLHLCSGLSPGKESKQPLGKPWPTTFRGEKGFTQGPSQSEAGTRAPAFGTSALGGRPVVFTLVFTPKSKQACGSCRPCVLPAEGPYQEQGWCQCRSSKEARELPLLRPPLQQGLRAAPDAEPMAEGPRQPGKYKEVSGRGRVKGQLRPAFLPSAPPPPPYSPMG